MIILKNFNIQFTRSRNKLLFNILGAVMKDTN